MADRRVAFALSAGILLIVAGVAYYLGVVSAGTLIVQVRDAPAEWTHLNVTFSEVRVHRADAEDESGWVNLTLAASTIDFITLGNLTRLLAMDRVPAGMYTQVRIVVGAAQGVRGDGSLEPLRVPDGLLKAVTPFTVPGGGVATVVLDFDLERSVTLTSFGWIFKPVLGAIEIR